MWTPEIELKPSLILSSLILLSHGAVAGVLLQLGSHFPWLIPLVLASATFHILQDGLKRLPRSVVRIWLDEKGWFWQRRDGAVAGPYQLHSRSRVDSRFIRLSFSRGLRGPAHILLTPAIIGHETFRQLQVFLRWAADKNQPLGR